MRTLGLGPIAVAAFCWAGSIALAAEPGTAVPTGEVPVAADSAPSAAADDYSFFESRIRPLFARHCYECHSAEADIVQGGLRLDRAELLARGGDGGAAVVAGRPDESRLIAAVRYDDPDFQMPPAGRLSDAEIADLAAWVERGAPFPPPTEDDPAANATDRPGIDVAAGRTFWSFQPLRRTAAPQMTQAAWPRTSIDPWLLAAMEAAGLRPSPTADRRTLIRRASFDLVGLPPTPEEVEAFVADDSPDAYARLIERLLASPHYGERWGRYWLDLVRYCDVPESWAATDASAWLYRDWVVAALNADMSYDQFVTRQLAADQMPECGPQDAAALGLLGLSPTYWKELKLAPGVIQTVVAEEWEERINTLSGTLLGLTVACARCHDHKFDPISTRDYYALAGVLASVRQASRAVIPPDQAAVAATAREQVKALQAELDKLAAIEPPPEDAAAQAAALRSQMDAIVQATPCYDSPLAYAVEEASLHVLPDGDSRTKLDYRAGEPQDVAMQVRGNPLQPGDVVPRGFIEVLSPAERRTFRQGSGRRELAEAIFSDAAPLAARVIVNRAWRHHFGRGLVETPSNFGAQGDRPSHPELLDDLAARFVAAGWSLKWLHREIVFSAAYQQSSAADAAKAAIDPDNRLLWRAHRRRLEVEPWRDRMLFAAGTLDLTLGGPSQELSDAANRRRTLYGTVRRRELSDLLRLYDFPDPTGHSPARVPTTTPLQQLLVLNGELLARQAAALAQRVRDEHPGDTPAQVARAYALLYGRLPTERQLALALEFLIPTAAEAPADEAWQQYAEVLLGSNELMFVD